VALARGLVLAGTLAAVGASLFAAVVHDGRGGGDEQLALRRLVLGGAVLAVAASWVDLAQQAAQLGGVLDGVAWHVLLHDGAYAGAVVRGLGLAFVAYAAGSRWRAPGSGPVLALGAALACGWCVVSGHPATHGAAAQAAMLAHVACASAWFGGLLALAVTLRHRRREGDLAGAGAVAARFSRTMRWVVAGLLGGGGVAALLLAGSLLHTTYGLVLCAKVGLALVVLGAGAYNHRRLVPASAWGALARTVAAEQALLVGVLALTAVLVGLDPQR
jgi:copper transport protein